MKVGVNTPQCNDKIGYLVIEYLRNQLLGDRVFGTHRILGLNTALSTAGPAGLVIP